jgi:hypothetical protein
MKSNLEQSMVEELSQQNTNKKGIVKLGRSEVQAHTVFGTEEPPMLVEPTTLDMLNAHRHLRDAATRCGRCEWANVEVDRLIERKANCEATANWFSLWQHRLRKATMAGHKLSMSCLPVQVCYDLHLEKAAGLC